MALVIHILFEDIELIIEELLRLSPKLWQYMLWLVKGELHARYAKLVINAPTDTKVFDQCHDEPKEMETLEDHFESNDTSLNSP